MPYNSYYSHGNITVMILWRREAVCPLAMRNVYKIWLVDLMKETILETKSVHGKTVLIIFVLRR